jgi:DNA-directed RNA polymerase specialized sigma24 family protein
MPKQKVHFQNIPEAEMSGTDYTTWAANRSAEGRGGHVPHAEPNELAEGAGYWAVDDATKEIQEKVRLMLQKAKQVLTTQQYNAFVLVDLKKLKLRDAAKVMEVNHARVDQLIKRARLKLQAVYNALD